MEFDLDTLANLNGGSVYVLAEGSWSEGIDGPAVGSIFGVNDDAGGYRKLILKDGLLMGFLCVGDIERSGILYGLMRDRIDLSDLKDSLCSSDFGLISLPEPLRREWLSGKKNPLTTAA